MAFKGLQPIVYGGREVWPLIEGGKGVKGKQVKFQVRPNPLAR